MSDDRKDLPPVSAPNFNEKLRETISTYLGNRGNRLDRGVTLRDLSEANIIALSKGFLASSGGKIPPIAGPGTALGAYEPDLTPAPTPSGFVVSAAISNLIIEHDAPLYTQGHGHGRTIVYGATWTGGTLPVFGDAVKLTEFTGTVGTYPTNPATSWFLWIKWMTADGVESAAPAGGTNGKLAQTGLEVSKLVLAMTGPGNPFTVVPIQTTLSDGSIVPAGTYTADAFIHNGQITNAKIANLAVDNAKIANLSVGKLDAGSLKVGSFISSSNYIAGSQGFRINADGLAEFSNVVVRGTVYATAGQIGGNTIDSTGVQSPGYAAGSAGWRLNSDGSFYANSGYFRGSVNTGSYTGYGWPTDGGGGAHISSNGILVGNYNLGKYFQLDSAGNLYAPQFSIINGAATFAGALSGASGTFSGSLTASAINAVNTINIAGSAITEHYLGAGPSNGGHGSILVGFGFTVPAGQTWQVSTSANARLSASGGGTAAVGDSTTFGYGDAGIELLYNGVLVDTSHVLYQGFGGDVSGAGFTQHTAIYTGGQSVTVQLRCYAQFSIGAANIGSPRAMVFISKK